MSDQKTQKQINAIAVIAGAISLLWALYTIATKDIDQTSILTLVLSLCGMLGVSFSILKFGRDEMGLQKPWERLFVLSVYFIGIVLSLTALAILLAAAIG